MTTVSGTPVNMKCHESLCYVAAGSSVIAVDLRTMQNVVTAAVHRPEIRSFAAVTSKYLLCTGGYDDSCDAMAVDGCRIATATYDTLRFRDFNNATRPAIKLEND
ncbi:hypothetical protein MTR_8g044020 [Medicago truncatula]|uniref:Uncharacterized protein n=1 Tax=Medicago truncatula TaxID=3880 RepID=G7L6Z5_MEDTR|nr:hypothetical protein MTR_8g044020 [Medicago truncatula]